MNQSRLIARLRRQAAVTLIETLLVVAIVAMLTVYGVSDVKQRTERTKIANTVEQFEQLSIAARAYYESLQTHWPDNISQLRQFLPKTVDEQALHNAWGYAFTLPLNSEIKPYYIASRVPNFLTAKLIKGKLPLARVQQPAADGSTEVRLYLTTPASVAWQGANLGAKIVDMQTIHLSNRHDYTVGRFTCPDNYTPKWTAGIRSFAKANNAGDAEFISGVSLCSPDSRSADCHGSNKPIFDDQLRLRMTSWTGSYDTNAELFLLRYCEPIA